MKKQFFYAAMALAVMSSCSKDNDRGIIDNPEENNDREVIALGVDAPSISASTRGTGSVGDVEGENNKWNSQRLFIYMIDKETGLEAKEGAAGAETPILDNGALQFRAPKKDAGADQSIRFYNTYDATTEKGTIQYKYYPTNGKYTFYGYHIDDATGATVSITETEKKVNSVTINGTQDLLAANTIDLAADDAANNDSPYKDIATTIGGDWAALVPYAFSARTARKKVVPVLKFNHQLARLKFFVRAGSESAAGYEYKTNTWVERKGGDANDQPLGMQVTKITLKDMVSIVDMDLSNATSVQNGTTTADFIVCSPDPDNNNMLDPAKGLINSVVPKYPYGAPDIPANDPDTKGTAVGAPVMFFPNGDITLSIALKQYVIDTEDEATGTKTYKEVEKSNTPLTIYEADITGATKKFIPGASYNVYITIYGFERVEVTAVLTAWTEGGDIDADIEGRP